jgi:SAM-dependent methyltransferase
MNYSYDEHYAYWVNLNKKPHYAHLYLEKPAILGLLENLDLANVKNILLLGSASGEEVQLFEKLNLDLKNINFVGIEKSIKLVEVANYNFIDRENVKFYHCSVEDFNKEFCDQNQIQYPFDLIVSCLTMHYIDDWIQVFKNLQILTKKGSNFIFSIQHPIKWGAQANRSSEKNTFLLGYTKFKKEKDYKIYGDYLTPRLIKDKLFGKIEIEYFHKSLSQIFDLISKADCQLVKFNEPVPVLESKDIVPDFYSVYSKIPLFAIFQIKL